MDSPPKVMYSEFAKPQTPPANLPSIPTIPNGPSKRKRSATEEPLQPFVKIDWMLEYKGLMNKYHCVLERTTRLERQGREMAFHYRNLELHYEKFKRRCKCVKEDDIIELN